MEQSMRRRLVSIAAISLILGTASPALAGYDRTEWGMSIGQVQRLYPGGKRTFYFTNPKLKGIGGKGWKGWRTYEVVQTVAGYRALVVFCFSTPDYGRQKKPGILERVEVRFLPPDAISADEILMDREDAEARMREVSAGLISKYGQPYRQTTCDREEKQDGGSERRPATIVSCGLTWRPKWPAPPFQEINLGQSIFVQRGEESHSVGITYEGQPPPSVKGL